MTHENATNNNDIKLDNLDFRIISLMALGQDNKQISSILKVPLSTIQRRSLILNMYQILKNLILKLVYCTYTLEIVKYKIQQKK